MAASGIVARALCAGGAHPNRRRAGTRARQPRSDRGATSWACGCACTSARADTSRSSSACSSAHVGAAIAATPGRLGGRSSCLGSFISACFPSGCRVGRVAGFGAPRPAQVMRVGRRAPGRGSTPCSRRRTHCGAVGDVRALPCSRRSRAWGAGFGAPRGLAAGPGGSSGATRFKGHKLNRESRLSTDQPAMHAAATTANSRTRKSKTIIERTLS